MPSFVTIAAPARDLPLPAFPSVPSVLTLPVAAIDNPTEQAFSLRVSLQAWSAASGDRLTPTGSDPPASVELGSVTPYPASNPGTFVFRLPETARALITRVQGRASLTVALEPIDAARPLREPLRVTLGALAWQ
jgi:hypothetical protein